MKYIAVQPAEIITTRDFPVYSSAHLASYFEMYKKGSENLLAPVPLIELQQFLPYFAKQELTVLNTFLTQNPNVRYFLMNGSHRTTCANLTKKPIQGMILESNDDIVVARQLKSNGQQYEHGLLDTIDENILEMVAHFKGTDKFETVEHKTQRMISERVIPYEMIECYLG